MRWPRRTVGRHAGPRESELPASVQERGARFLALQAHGSGSGLRSGPPLTLKVQRGGDVPKSRLPFKLLGECSLDE